MTAGFVVPAVLTFKASPGEAGGAGLPPIKVIGKFALGVMLKVSFPSPALIEVGIGTAETVIVSSPPKVNMLNCSKPVPSVIALKIETLIALTVTEFAASVPKIERVSVPLPPFTVRGPLTPA